MTHTEIGWNIEYLSKNPSITCKFIEDHPEYNWDIINLSSNPSTKALNNERKELFLQSCNYSEVIKNSFTNQSLFDRNLLGLIMQFV